jgi:hypothetical protein
VGAGVMTMMMGLIRSISFYLSQTGYFNSCLLFGLGFGLVLWIGGSSSAVCIMKIGSGFGGVCVIVYNQGLDERENRSCVAWPLPLSQRMGGTL